MSKKETPEEFMERKGWSRSNPQIGGALFVGVAELLREYAAEPPRSEAVEEQSEPGEFWNNSYADNLFAATPSPEAVVPAAASPDAIKEYLRKWSIEMQTNPDNYDAGTTGAFKPQITHALLRIDHLIGLTANPAPQVEKMREALTFRAALDEMGISPDRIAYDFGRMKWVLSYSGNLKPDEFHSLFDLFYFIKRQEAAND